MVHTNKQEVTKVVSLIVEYQLHIGESAHSHSSASIMFTNRLIFISRGSES